MLVSSVWIRFPSLTNSTSCLQEAKKAINKSEITFTPFTHPVFTQKHSEKPTTKNAGK